MTAVRQQWSITTFRIYLNLSVFWFEETPTARVLAKWSQLIPDVHMTIMRRGEFPRLNARVPWLP